MQPLILHINNGNEGDDEEDFEDDQGELSQYRKKQHHDAMLRAFVESEWIPDGRVCTGCSTTEATFRCLKCGTGVFYVKHV